MRKTIYYKYNPLTDTYERAYPSRKEKMWALLCQSMTGLLTGVGVFLVIYFFFGPSSDRRLEQENSVLKSQLEVLNRRADQAIAVMDDIIDRDNNFYRVMMQSDRISAGKRYAGLERARLYGEIDSLSDSELLKSVTDKLDRLDRQLYTESQSFDQLKELAQSSKERLDHIPAIQPISDKYLKQMASGYGYRSDPVYGTRKFHEGLDYSSDIGTPVYATGNGTVKKAGWDGAYGNAIDIDHGYNYLTRFAHLSQILVKPGQKVKRGDLIGKVGNTGKSTGPHLHYEVRLNGQPQNPVNYYFYDLTPEEYDNLIRLAENAGHVMD